MAGTRSSTRQKASAAPKYNEDQSSSAEETKPKRNGTGSTRRKRTREEDEEEEEDDKVTKANSPPAKSIATTKSKGSKTSTCTAKDKAKSRPAPPPEPSSSTNRSADGSQEIFWLLKAEPLPRFENGVNVAFSISDLRACTKPEPWTGVRNPQARNNMQAMRKGDLGFFYHSNAKPSGVVGIVRIVDEAKVDETAFDPKDPYYDSKSDRDKPKWFGVGVEFVREFEHVVDLHRIKAFAKDGGPLRDMQLVTNSRLSVCRVRREEWELILGLAEGGEGEEKEGDKEDIMR